MHRRNLIITLLCLLSLIAAVPALDCSPMCQHGTCVANHGNKSCLCDLNWSGDSCSQFICDVDSTLCGNGICVINPNNQSLFLCACPTGYTGDRCQYAMPGAACQNVSCNGGGTCYASAANLSSAVCTSCLSGRYGPLCQWPGSDPCVGGSGACSGHGVCSYGEKGIKQCSCSRDYNSSSSSCSLPTFDYCFGSNCTNGGSCDLVASIKAQTTVCACTANYTGPNCTLPFNICAGRCLHGGTCSPTEGGNYFKCSCPPLYTGEQCEMYMDPCARVVCFNGGTCVPNVSSVPLWSCQCPRGFGGPNCSVNTQCKVNPCQHGGTCVPTANGDYVCNCTSGYWGINCASAVDICQAQPCGDHGVCHLEGPGELEYFCTCSVGYTGPSCDVPDNCADVSCGADGVCVNLHNSYACVCAQAIGNASVCAVPNYCVGNPCGSGICLSNTTGYTCLCADGVLRSSCSVQSCGVCENGGTCTNISGVVTCVCPTGFTGPMCDSMITPPHQCSSCHKSKSAHMCDLECFTSACSYAGDAKCLTSPRRPNPWANCNNSYQCPLKFNNGHCDVQCNTSACLYDGNDCDPPVKTPPSCPEALQDKCSQEEGDGVCHPQCYTAICPYDQQDCKAKNLASGFLVMIIFGPQPFQNSTKLQFLSNLSTIIHSQPYVVSSEPISADQLNSSSGYVGHLNTSTLVYNLTLQLDNTFCHYLCPKSTVDAANTLQAYYATGYTAIGAYTVADVYSVSANTSPPPGAPSNSNIIGGTVVGVLAVIALVGLVALVLGKRDRIRAKLWRPQSPMEGGGGDHTSSGDRRRSTTGTIASTNGSRADSEEFFIKAAKLARTDTDNSITMSSVTVTAKMDTESVGGPKGERKWTCLHYEALRNPKLVQELVSNHRHHNKSPDINARGPGGYTPLMLAVMSKRIELGDGMSSRSNSESSGDCDASILVSGIHRKKVVMETNSSSGSEVSGGGAGVGVLPGFDPTECSVGVLLGANGIDLNSCNDCGQTALHLAAACSRGDHVQQLLKCGANPNVQDKEGRTPLQVAIGACAEGTFTILVNHPSTDINLASEGQITPLMLAVKHLNLLMVKGLLRRNAEITAADSEGRTAIHWAAVINNLDALKLLMRQGPETLKDAQDNKGQTALFLACREGAVDCVRHLLDCFANTTLLDNLDRSPMQIAKDRLHNDIVEMLKQATHGPYSQFSVMHTQKGYQSYVQEMHFPPPRCHQVVAPPPSTMATHHMDTGDLHHMAGDPREQNPYACVPRPRCNMVTNGYQDCHVGVHHQLGGPFVTVNHSSSSSHREDAPKVLTKVKSSVSAYNPWLSYQQGLETTLQQQSPIPTSNPTTSTSMAPPPQSLSNYKVPCQVPVGVDSYVDNLDLDAIADLLPSTMADEFQAAYINCAMPTMTNTKPLQHLPYDAASEYSPPQGSCSNSSPSYPSPPNSNGLVPSTAGGHSDTPSPESQDSKKSSPYMETHYVIEPVYHGDCRFVNIHNQFPYQLPTHAAESAV